MFFAFWESVAGTIVLVADGFKGWLAVAVIPDMVQKHLLSSSGWDAEYLKIIAGVFVILGHNYTCWLKFKGGKGIATSAGVLAALMPVTFLIEPGHLGRGLPGHPVCLAGLDCGGIGAAICNLGRGMQPPSDCHRRHSGRACHL